MMSEKDIKNLLTRRIALEELKEKFNRDHINSTDNGVSALYKNSVNNIKNIISDIDKEISTYIKSTEVGKWLLRFNGMTTDIAAGLLIYFDIRGKECAAQFIKYAGADSYKHHHNSNLRILVNKLMDNFKNDPDSLYGKINDDKFFDLITNENTEPSTARIRADRYMRKIFISHLFEEMYREYYKQLPKRHDIDDCLVIEPEVPYTYNINEVAS